MKLRQAVYPLIPIYEGTLLTREQVEEISTRISKIVSENISKAIGEVNGFRRIFQGQVERKLWFMDWQKLPSAHKLP